MNLNHDPNILYFMKPIECNNSTLHHKPFHECYFILPLFVFLSIGPLNKDEVGVDMCVCVCVCVDIYTS
jgi:hypothetical protein